MSSMYMPPCKKPGENENKKRERKNKPCTLLQRQKVDSRTIIRGRRRLRITGVISGGNVGIRSNRVRHEGLSGRVQSLNGISVAPVVVSGVGEASGLENLHRRDTTFDKEVTKESSDGSVRGAREVLGAQEVLVLAAQGCGVARNGRLVMTEIMDTVLTV